ncbi:hypothetical protein [Burkholderia plantarii]|uniref:hypothetical protein n=1 Tax=Burkholderia plantarii TaxID=41899 RepID=UPI0018DDED9E|nr:hypothetical protein [Burkholderia plantarii]MBI0331289.1 hypothetical protein [Burkholderia plantarii]
MCARSSAAAGAMPTLAPPDDGRMYRTAIRSRTAIDMTSSTTRANAAAQDAPASRPSMQRRKRAPVFIVSSGMRRGFESLRRVAHRLVNLRK